MELGLEPTPEAYVANMVEVFREVRRVLRPDGVCWVNMGDCYATGAGKVGDCPGGGEQGERWAGSSGSRGERSRGLRDGRHSGKHLHVHAKGPMTQPNRMPIAGLKPKDLVGMPWRVAFALQADGWWLRSDVIWSKPNPMPESVTDRPTKAHEYIFLLTKSARYFYDAEAVKEPSAYPIPQERKHSGDYSVGSGRNDAGQHRSGGFVTVATRNLRSVWTIPSHPFQDAHFATFPPKLAETCIKAGTSERGCCPACGAQWLRMVDAESVIDPCPMTTGAAKKAALGELARTTPQGRTCGSRRATTLGFRPSCTCQPADPVPCTVIDPFAGSGTTLLVADRLQRDGIGIDLNLTYVDMATNRIAGDAPLFAATGVER